MVSFWDGLCSGANCYFQGGYTRLKYRFRLKWLALLGVLPLHLSLWDQTVDPGSPKRDGYKCIFTSCKLNVFSEKNCSWENGLTFFHKNLRNIYTNIYIYMQHHKFCVYLIWSHLQIETAHHHSSTCQYKKQVHFEIIAIQTSKHPNTLGCQNLTIRFLVALD